MPKGGKGLAFSDNNPGTVALLEDGHRNQDAYETDMRN